MQKTDDFIGHIFDEFKKTRMHFGSIEIMFKISVGIYKVNQTNINTEWKQSQNI